MTVRNTPDHDTRLCPARALLGRDLRDFLPVSKKKLMGEMWADLSENREMDLARRGQRALGEWQKKTKELCPLKVGDFVMIQNQSGNHPTIWDKRGTVVEDKGFDHGQG